MNTCARVAAEFFDNPFSLMAIVNDAASLKLSRLDRDIEITKASLNGETGASLEKKYGLTRERILQIVKSTCGKANRHLHAQLSKMNKGADLNKVPRPELKKLREHKEWFDFEVLRK